MPLPHITMFHGAWHAEKLCITMPNADDGTRTYSNSMMVFADAIKHRGPGKIVIVRPSWNERDERGRLFAREWRSYDGDAFTETKRYLAGNNLASLDLPEDSWKVVMDSDLFFPNVPAN